MVANPASGKDVRRLVARASVFDNQEKRAIVGRVLTGAVAAGAREFAYLDDPHGIVAGALEDQGSRKTRGGMAGRRQADGCEVDGLEARALDSTRTGTPLDTISAARALKDMACAVTITLGGDGTNRAFAIGWPDAPLLPLSTGTNNVFPSLLEGTVAGAAAGLIAAGRIAIDEVATQQKLIRVEIEDERDDLALIDAVLSRERFVGARALLAPEALDTALLTRADPAAVGITSIGGLLEQVGRNEDAGLYLRFGPGSRAVQAPIAPGFYRRVDIADCRTVELGERVEITGPGVLAFDGERDRTLKAGQKASLFVERSGPWVIDVAATLKLAAEKGLFSIGSGGDGIA